MPSFKSRESEPESNSSSEMINLLAKLRAEILGLKTELKLLKDRPKEAEKIRKETDSLEATVGSVLLDLAEEVPFLGRAVKWFRK